MKRNVFAPRSRTARRLLASGALMGLLLAVGAVAIGDVSPEAKRSGASNARESLSLFAEPLLILRTNQIECGIDNQGNVCSNVFNSPTAAGGAWPVGSPNAYIFNTGLQIAGIMGTESADWANDTVGAYFFDARGTQPSGTGLTNIFDSLDPDDVENWPDEAIISDPDLYNDALIGRTSISQQDTWVKYWDGSPTRITNRQHPMGIEVTQRSLAWNYPFGNESMLYFIYSFKNVTDTEDFQVPNELQFFGGEDRLPAGGITLTDVYAAFSTDMDVSNAGENFSSAVLPFDLGLSYHGGFAAPEFIYPPDLFFPPFFANAPGIVGIKYLRSPISPDTGEEVGLTLFSGTDNASTGFPDPLGDKQLWRYLSGNLNPAAGDFPCNNTPEVDTGIPETTERSICYLNQTAADTRFYQASGPFTLAPGDAATIVVAYIIAATVQTMPNGDPSGIVANAAPNTNAPGVPSFHPGYPSARGCDASGNACTVTDPVNELKTLEKGAGWVSYSGPAPSGRGGGALEAPENKLPIFDETGQPYVTTVPGSLLGKALVAQTIFNNKFLLGFAPEQPVFYLVPGNAQVTVVWNPSATEELGDPFFVVASDSTSALFNPNYRELDVEGYRILRGTSPNNLAQVQQFDYANTSYTDVTCETVLPTEDLHDNSSAPEGTIGFVAGDVCPEDFSKISSIDGNLVFNNGSAGGPPGGGVVRLADSTAFAVNLTAVSADEWVGTTWQNTGVPFGFVDTDVVNNFTYFYAVSAFDFNSYASGPYTLESATVSQPVTPRQDQQNLTEASFSIYLAGDDGQQLQPGPIPSIDSETGRFSGPFPPTDAYDLTLVPVVERLLGQGATRVAVDSIQMRASGNLASGTQEFPPSDACTAEFSGLIASPFGACWRTFITATLTTGESQSSDFGGYVPWWSAFGEPGTISGSHVAASIPYNPDALESFGIDSGATSAVVEWTTGEAQNFTAAEGAINRRRGHYATGARWIDGDTRQGAQAIEDPSSLTRVGSLPQVDTIFAPLPYTPVVDGGAPIGTFDAQCMNRAQAFNDRAADVVWTWSGGTLSARDITHNVDVPFHPAAGPTWGFLTTDANGNGVLDWHDFNYIDRAYQVMRQVDGGSCNRFAGTTFDAAGTASPVSLSATPMIMPTSTGGIETALDLENGASPGQTGTGFGLYAYGHRFIFETSSLPADGTVWTLRTYKGELATDDDASANPSGYTYIADGAGGGGADGGPLPALIPGLQFVWDVQSGNEVVASFDLQDVHTVPDPYLATSQYDRSPTSKALQFVNLPPQATIRIYTLTGVLVDQIEHDDSTGGGRATWNLRNRNNQFVASGVYFFHLATPAGDERVGKFTIVNFAGQN
jgi:hypothetical protein